MSSDWDDYPAWACEIQVLMSTCPHFVLSGNVHDLYFGPPDDPNEPDQPALMDLVTLVQHALQDHEVRVVLAHEPAVGTRLLGASGLDQAEVERILGWPRAKLPGAGQLDELGQLIAYLAGPNCSEPVGLVIESASRLVRSTARLTVPEFDFFRSVERSTRRALQHPTGSGQMRHSPVVWAVDSDRDLPAWLLVGNDTVRSVSVPLPHSGDRQRLAANRLPGYAEETQFAGDLARPVRVLTEQTAGMGLSAVSRILDIAADEGLGPDRVDDAARSYRVGVVENPWHAEYIATRLRTQIGKPPDPPDPKAPIRLDQRVLGQDDAVAKALDILARSAAGLTAAEAGPTAMRPRGVLFLAGPTGVGKTELAKAVTELLFDDERFYVRFDMSEFSAEQSADRLIGSPPGYVGHQEGGQLTNAMRERPFSVVLFDEVEKAHARILDKFLQVLDDGRLTDGRGETVYFTEALIVFTSNLGVYREVHDGASDRATARRELAITPDSPPTREGRADAIRKAIRDHFILELGRPELLNRIGEDNIVVFDFIDEPTALRILDGMLANVSTRLEREHGFTLQLADDSLEQLRRACLTKEVLAMGGRGIGSKLETALVNPLSRLLVMQAERPAQPRLGLHQVGERWEARWS